MSAWLRGAGDASRKENGNDNVTSVARADHPVDRDDQFLGSVSRGVAHRPGVLIDLMCAGNRPSSVVVRYRWPRGAYTVTVRATVTGGAFPSPLNCTHHGCCYQTFVVGLVSVPLRGVIDDVALLKSRKYTRPGCYRYYCF